MARAVRAGGEQQAPSASILDAFFSFSPQTGVRPVGGGSLSQDPSMDTNVIGAGMASYPAGVQLRVGLYDSTLRPAIQLICADDGMPYASLSVNLPGTPLLDGEFCVAADWNLPADLKTALLATGKFADTGRLSTGLPEGGAIWRIDCPELLSQLAGARVVARRRPAHRIAALV